MNESEQFNKLLNEIVNNRTELRNVIEASEARVLLKIESLKEKIRYLEKENKGLKNKVEKLERKSKENGIVIFGMNPRGEEGISLELVFEEIYRLLGVTISKSDVNNFIWIRNARNNPIKLDLVSNLKKQEIFRNCKKLKGTRISIAHDLTFEQREDNKLLRYHLKNARENAGITSYIRGNKLFVDGTAYTAESLREEKEEETVENQNHSAPATPNTRTRNLESDSEIEKETQIRTQTKKTGIHQQIEKVQSSTNQNLPKKPLKPNPTPGQASTEKLRLRSTNRK